MDDQPKNGATLDEVLETVNNSFTRMEERFAEVKSDISSMKSDISSMKSDISSMKSDISDLKSDVHELNTTMVTKDYLDRKVQEFKDESTIKLRKENEKVATIVRTLREKTIFSNTEAQGILAMEPFPLPK
jgi:predicted RNase H-like nuclease (RuvC/YqgF family)